MAFTHSTGVRIPLGSPMDKKQKCVHIRVPLYDQENQRHANLLNALISGGEIGYYGTLTRLAVMTVESGKFYRETCEKCDERMA
jgi:hypothetical protein